MVVSSWAFAAHMPNIVFIMADDLGWRDVGCYGNAFVETPTPGSAGEGRGEIHEGAAADGLLAYTGGGAFTGMHPVRTGITDYSLAGSGPCFWIPLWIPSMNA